MAESTEKSDSNVECELEEMSPEDFKNMMGENLRLMKGQLIEKKDELKKLRKKKRSSKKDKAIMTELGETIEFMEEEIKGREEFLE